jgi:hypothetical protein
MQDGGMKTYSLFLLPEKSSQLESAADHHFLDNISMFWDYPALWARLDHEINDASHSGYNGRPNRLHLPSCEIYAVFISAYMAKSRHYKMISAVGSGFFVHCFNFL